MIFYGNIITRTVYLKYLFFTHQNVFFFDKFFVKHIIYLESIHGDI